MLFVLDIFQQLITLAVVTDDHTPKEWELREAIIAGLFKPYMDNYLQRIGGLLRKSPSKQVLESGVQTLSNLAPLVHGSSEIGSLLDISVFLLDQPLRRVNPKTKGDILRILQHFLPQYDLEQDASLRERIFRTLSSLFGFFKDRVNRQVLSEVMKVFAQHAEALVEVSLLCCDLNSFSPRKIDEPDFDKRLRAFTIVNEEKYDDFTPQQWLPLLYNMLFYVKDNDELAIRTSASYSLRRFVDVVAKAADGDLKTPFMEHMSAILLPSLHNGSTRVIRTSEGRIP